MHILGIQLISGDRSVIKNLKPNTWYPLYDLEKFKDGPDLSEYKENENFYQLGKNDTTKVSISCIVGENGSGKSTLLDILYRIINNFSWHIKNSNKTLPTQIYYAYGFHAKLYFELFDEIGYIEIVANDFDKKHPKDCICFSTKNLPIQYFAEQQFDINKLNAFFYTIVTNYSLYSFTPDDYEYEEKYFDSDDADHFTFYPAGIFNKNDSYISPIVLLPYRDDYGKILTDNEKDLAIQRIIALSIYLYKKHGTSLIENKIPNTIKYSFNYNYDMKKDGEYVKNKKAIDKIKNEWKSHFGTKLNKFDENKKEVISFYLGYKTFKFIMRYGFHDENATQTTENKAQIIKNFDESFINRIINEDKTFMTLKIRQTCYYINHLLPNLENGTIKIDEYFNNHIFNTIDDYFMALPPPFYIYDLFFIDENNTTNKKNDFSLSKMSSGEKQILFNLSYVLYHLKNLSTKSRVISSRAINATPEYKNAVLIFDEAELYMHPEYQRQYIYKLLSSIQKCHFENIKDIHIIFATHSPYLLSDVKSNNVLMLEDGKVRESQFTTQTFSANIYDLLKTQFFMTSPVGEFARKKMQELLKCIENKELINDETLQQFIDTIGDNYIRKALNRLRSEYQQKIKRNGKDA